MFEHFHYSDVDSLTISSPSSNIEVLVSEQAGSRLDLALEKIRWPAGANLTVTQRGRSVNVEVVNETQNPRCQVDFKITAPRHLNLNFSAGNCAKATIQDLAGLTFFKVGNLNELYGKNTGSIDLDVGNLNHALLEDIHDELRCKMGTGNLRVVYHSLTSNRQIAINAGVADFKLQAPIATIINDNLMLPKFTVEKRIDHFDSENPRAHQISLAGKIGVGSVNVQILNPVPRNRGRF